MKLDDDSFGALHVRWCSAAFRMAIQEGDRLMQLLQGELPQSICDYCSAEAPLSFHNLRVV